MDEIGIRRVEREDLAPSRLSTGVRVVDMGHGGAVVGGDGEIAVTILSHQRQGILPGQGIGILGIDIIDREVDREGLVLPDEFVPRIVE